MSFIYRLRWTSGNLAFEYKSELPVRLGEIYYLFCDALFNGQRDHIMLQYGDKYSCSSETRIYNTVIVDDHLAEISVVWIQKTVSENDGHSG